MRAASASLTHLQSEQTQVYVRGYTRAALISFLRLTLCLGLKTAKLERRIRLLKDMKTVVCEMHHMRALQTI